MTFCTKPKQEDEPQNKPTFKRDESDNKLFTNIQVKDIKISSEAFENKEGKRIHVSAIEITLVNEK